MRHPLRMTRLALKLTLFALIASATLTALAFGVGVMLDGDVIAYYGDGTTGRYSVSLLDVNRALSHRVTPEDNRAYSTPVWSPDGALLAMRAWDNGSGIGEIVLMDMATGDLRTLAQTPTIMIANVVWARDSRSVYYYTPVMGMMQLHEVRVADGTVTLPDRQAHPAGWSPDGQHVAWAQRDSRAPIANIMIADGDESNPRAITDLDTDDTQPAWSPDGTQLAFFSQALTAGERPRLVLVDADGGNLWEVATYAAAIERPVWSPDGRTIAYLTATSNIGFDIALVDVETGQTASLTDSNAFDTAAAWSPDGRRIAFVRAAAGSPVGRAVPGQTDIMVVNADGTRLRWLTDTFINEHAPVWRP